MLSDTAPDVVLFISTPSVGGGGGGGGFPPSWVNLPAGGTLTIAPAASITYVTVDGTGAANTLNLPAAAVNGQTVYVSITSNAAQPNLTINFGAGNAASDPNNPGVILPANAVAVVRNQGALLAYKFQTVVNAPWATKGWIASP